MTTRIGQLRHRVTFQQPGKGKDEFGQPIPGNTGFEDVCTVWAKVRPAGSNERLVAAQTQSGQTHVLITHYTPTLAAAKGAWRVLYGERGQRVFGIVGLPREVEDRGRWLVFDCTEKVNG